MGLFAKLFGSKEPEFTLATEVYMHRRYVNQLLAEQLEGGNVMVITFFDSTKQTLKGLCKTEEAKSRVLHYQPVSNSSDIHHITQFLIPPANKVLIAERYPLQQREVEFLQKIGWNEGNEKLTAYCALDDVLMLQFGGDRIASLMQKMGMSETESVKHNMVSSSIRNAQKKLQQKVAYEQQAKSPEDWFRINFMNS